MIIIAERGFNFPWETPNEHNEDGHADRSERPQHVIIPKLKPKSISDFLS
jgi:hypothetical protein